MVLFSGLPYPISIMYIKVAGSNNIVSIPFVEALAMLREIEYDHRQSAEQTQKLTHAHYVFSGVNQDASKGKDGKYARETYVVAKREMMQHLEQDIFAGKYKISDIAIQPADELIVEEVKKLIGI